MALALGDATSRGCPRSVRHHHADEVEFGVSERNTDLIHLDCGRNHDAALEICHLSSAHSAILAALVVHRRGDHRVMVGNPEVGARRDVLYPTLGWVHVTLDDACDARP